ncbi:helix-turn-helix transcriptional regulator [Altererythrobacter sp.]|nr:helix-turn-helix transcriptional regulator [Altererythrobacter sp.]
MTELGDDEVAGFGTLTQKQRDVLDFLIEHKTSKEIARELDISPHTVDQRINFSKRKLGVSSRSQLATLYRRQREIYDQSIYDESYIDGMAIPLESNGTDNAAAYLLHDGIASTDEHRTDAIDEVDYRVVPEMFEGRTGKVFRIAAALIAAILIIILALGGLAIFSTLSEMLSA